MDHADPGTSGQHADVGAAEEDVPKLRARLLEALQQVERLRDRSQSFEHLEAAAQAQHAAGVTSKRAPKEQDLARSAAAASGAYLQACCKQQPPAAVPRRCLIWMAEQ